MQVEIKAVTNVVKSDGLIVLSYRLEYPQTGDFPTIDQHYQDYIARLEEDVIEKAGAYGTQLLSHYLKSGQPPSRFPIPRLTLTATVKIKPSKDETRPQTLTVTQAILWKQRKEIFLQKEESQVWDLLGKECVLCKKQAERKWFRLPRFHHAFFFAKKG